MKTATKKNYFYIVFVEGLPSLPITVCSLSHVWLYLPTVWDHATAVDIRQVEVS